MIAKRICSILLFIAVYSMGTCGIRADEPSTPIADPSDALKALQSKIDVLRKEGKTDEADKLEIERANAIMRIAGAKPQGLPEIHADLPGDPFAPPPIVDLPKVIQPGANPANSHKEQQVRSLLTAAASLKAAGLEEDAARYKRLASQLAKNDDSVEVIRLRDEVAELRSEVERLRKEVEGLTAKSWGCAPVARPLVPNTTYVPPGLVPGPAPGEDSPPRISPR